MCVCPVVALARTLVVAYRRVHSCVIALQKSGVESNEAKKVVTDAFVRVNMAHQVLSDPESRADYLRSLTEGGGGGGRGRGGRSGAQYAYKANQSAKPGLFAFHLERTNDGAFVVTMVRMATVASGVRSIITYCAFIRVCVCVLLCLLKQDDAMGSVGALVRIYKIIFDHDGRNVSFESRSEPVELGRQLHTIELRGKAVLRFESA